MAMNFEDRLRDRDPWPIGDECSAGRVLELLSTRTAFLVVRECFYGTTRFDDFVARIGASAPAVSRALAQLKAARIVAPVPYREPGSRAREEYRLTEAGEELLPVLLSLMQWGDAHLQEGRPPLSFVEADTGRPIRVRVTADPAPQTPSDDIEIRLNPDCRSPLAAAVGAAQEARESSRPGDPSDG
ncbi:winged helix-turn-helix transcriptional regulator [Streptomyces olivochromogenes]|uniref:winged helix-turn-helix transcriptional regulator n=1 Tax=Streptomyces olivochromogenes TaxID=1963 RepID=UPI001F201E33|nr:helix-turn-helix domain-containing protein [Streptomyces olivochromogenes]